MSGKKAIQSVKWNFIGVIGSQIAKMVVTIILTRILLPQDFGLLALGLSIIIMGNMFADFGLASALIQKRDMSDSDIRYVFTLQVLFGATLTLTLYLLAPYISYYYREDQVETILKALSLVFLIKSLSLTSISLLQKNLEFKKLQIIQLSSYLISYFILGIPLALFGFGVWSLVAAQLSQAILQAIFSLAIQRHAKKPLLFHSGKEQLLNFGVKSIANNLLSWIIDNLNTFMIGYFQGVSTLGHYNRILTLTKMPMDMITSGFQKVLFSFYSEIQDQEEHIRKIYLSSIAFIALAIFPMFFTLALIPESTIGAVFGEKWIPHANIMTPLSLTMSLNVLLAMAGPILWGHNKGELEIKAQAYSAIIAIFVIYLLSQRSIFYASIGIMISFSIRLYFINTALFRFINIKWKDFILSTYRPAVLGILVSTGTHYVDNIIMTGTNSYTICLIGDFLVALSLLLCLIFAKPRMFIDDNLTWLLEKNKEILPRAIGQRLWDRS